MSRAFNPSTSSSSLSSNNKKKVFLTGSFRGGSSSGPPSASVLEEGEQQSSQTQQLGSEGGGSVTNYRSFAEFTSNKTNNNNNANNNSNENKSQSRTLRSPAGTAQGGSEPVNLMASHEVLLRDQRNLNDNRYRGFSTSMHDMYSATEFERVDCCSMACAGIFQSDRDRFLLQGITPPSIARRFWVHVFFPMAIFGLAACGAMRIPDKYMNQLFTTASVFLLVVYLVLQCFKGRSKRIEIRKDLLWTKAQLQKDPHQNLSLLLDQNPPDDFNQEQEYYLGQTQRDFGCAHPCCMIGCYKEDRAAYEIRLTTLYDDQQIAENERQVARDSRRRHANLSRFLWDYTCPAIWCGHQLQCCGMCALAQEAREVESAVLPAAYRRVDYVSMQPISHYYPAIYKRRYGTFANRTASGRGGGGAAGLFRGVNTTTSKREIGGRKNAGMEDSALQRLASQDMTDADQERLPRFPLSNLSWQLINFAMTITALVFAWSLVGKFFWKYALNLTVPDWRIFDWKDFLVYITVWLQGVVLTAVLAYLCNRPCPAFLSLDAMIKFFAAGFCLSTALAIAWELVLGVIARVFISLLMAIAGVDIVVDEDGYNSSYEERDWMVFGADSFARTVTAKAASDSYLRAFGHRHPVIYTIYLAFCSFVLAAFVEETCKYFAYRMVEHPDFMTQREIEEAMTVVIQHFEDEGDDDEETKRREEMRIRQRQELEQLDFSKQKKSVQSLGAAITLSMLCVAMGFTCCENLVYIFIYSGSSIGMEISVLVARTLFPVHPIAAALQSIRVIERDVEVTRTARLGKILTPAVLFHGTYDFLILWIDFLTERKDGNYIERQARLSGLLSFLVSGLVIVAALVYYMISAARQRSRLQVTDASIESGQSVLL